MARTSDAADYMVTQCQACGMLNVIPREYQDGQVCANCSGGPLMPVGYAILQERPTSRITVQVDVERDQLVLNIKVLKPLSSFNTYLTLPKQYIPSSVMFVPTMALNTGIRIGTSGEVMPCANIGTGAYIQTAISYVIK